MEGKYSGNDIVAPFVLKTYEMVDDPLTDSFITWGTANNSFVVLDSLYFSHSLLPANFKHNNFSSFVRQLNTYGFKKVDPDRWEFANQWFLRGQYHLLRNIVRRKSSSNSNSNSTTPNADDDDDEDHQLLTEIATLRKEQTALQHQLDSMKKRLETTEKRPHQMMAFLHKVVDDPEILPRIMLHRHPSPTRPPILPHKKIKRLILSSSSSSSTTSFDADDPNPRAAQQLLSAPLPPLAGDEIKYFTEMTVEDSHPPPPYPFSLFGCGF